MRQVSGVQRWLAIILASISGAAPPPDLRPSIYSPTLPADMPIFEADPHFIERLRRETTSRGDRSCETMPEPTSTPIPIRLCEHLSLHRRAFVLRAPPDRGQQPG